MVKPWMRWKQKMCSVVWIVYNCVVLINADLFDLSSAISYITSQVPDLDPVEYQHLQELNRKSSLPHTFNGTLASITHIASSSLNDLPGNVYRRYDGIGNNLDHPFWGSSLHVQRRVLPNRYDDNETIPRYRGQAQSRLPGSRVVSVNCFRESIEDNKEFFDRQTSQLMWQFGQFVDHDVTLTESVEESECCKAMLKDGSHIDMFNGRPCFPIPVPEEDRFFNSDCMDFRRSVSVEMNGAQEQINGITSYLDASNIYGQSENQAYKIREMKGGRLLVEKNNMLPNLDVFQCTKSKMPKCPHSGDKRVNEFPGLTMMHTVFHREHNRIAGELAKINAHWDDEKLFQESRKILIGQYQHVIYTKFLPKLLGPDILNRTKITNEYQYDPSLDTGVLNEFSSAAFRYGHSQVNQHMNFNSSKEFNISDVFFRPDLVSIRGWVNFRNIIENQARHFANKVDSFFTRQLTDKLFLNIDGPGVSFDLPARTIQRGRDHGVQPYLRYLDLCVQSLGWIEGVQVMTLPTCLSTCIYRSVEDVDLFLGGISEAPVPGGLVGHTFGYIIGDQFRRLKHGDRFFYDTQDEKIGFTKDQLKSIKKTSLAAILCRNGNLVKIQPLALSSRRAQGNKWVKCNTIPDIDFSLWREEPEADTSNGASVWGMFESFVDLFSGSTKHSNGTESTSIFGNV